MSETNEFNSHPHEPRLSLDDQRAFDALHEAGFARQSMEAASLEDARRADAMCALLGLMCDYPVEDAQESLLDATMARIDQAEHERVARMKFDTRQERSESGRRWWRVPDFITVAAVLLIGVSVLWPMLTSFRQHSLDFACNNNMRKLGYGFGAYAADYNGSMPVAIAGPSMPWDQVRNIVNLQPLVKNNYCQVSDLTCPAHQHRDEMEMGPSYSYRWFVEPSRAKWGAGPRVTVVLGDLNPVIDPARSGIYVPPLSTSINHGGRGQNVLDQSGATMWLEDPIVGGRDNIWLPDGADHLESGEQPVDDEDVFLVH